MRKRTTVALVGVGLLAVAGITFGPASPSQAHTGAATAVATCPNPTTGTGLVTVTVTNDHPLIATVTASDNTAIAVGATIPKSGSKSFKITVPAPAAGITATANLSLRWSDGFTQSGITATATVDSTCTGPATVVVPDLPITPPTCTADGSLPWTSNPAAENPNGYEFPGQGFRVYLSPAYTGPGTYTATVQKVGAGFDPAFPNGTKVTGNTVQTLTVLPATAAQSTNADAPCYVRPDVPVAGVPVLTITPNNCVPAPDEGVKIVTWDIPEGLAIGGVTGKGSAADEAAEILKASIGGDGGMNHVRSWILPITVLDGYTYDGPDTITLTQSTDAPNGDPAQCTEPTTPPTGEPTTPAPSDGPTTGPTDSPSPTAGTTPPASSPSAPSVSPSAPTRTSHPAPRTTPSSTTTAAPVAADTSHGTLAYTGADRTALIAGGVLAVALIALGSLLLVMRARRRRAEIGGE